ncbi:MAG: HipA domain-containing protein [Candidatus Omnitrophota bacterium]
MNKYCDFCGIKTKNDSEYHSRCLKKLFNTDYFPKIDIDLKNISLKAQDMAGKMSISGVQVKLSLKLNRKNKKLEVAQENGEYILKPQLETFPNIPQNENLCMNIAYNLGIAVPSHTLIQLADNSTAYIVKRFDRDKKEKLHMEDFMQILTEEGKYKCSLEKIGQKIKTSSEFPGLDVQLFFERVLLFFIIGNGDAHLKNFSLIYTPQGRIRLSPAYDIVCTKLVIPDEDDLALTLNGKKNKITYADFKYFADYLGIKTETCFKNILTKISNIKELVNNSRLTDQEKKDFLRIIESRLSQLDYRS